MIVGDLARAVWKERHVPHDQEWVDAIFSSYSEKKNCTLVIIAEVFHY